MRLFSWEYLIILLPVFGYLSYLLLLKKGFKYHSTIKYPEIKNIQPIIHESIKLKVRRHLLILKLAALLIFIVALARPQSGQRSEDVETKGIDIMLALDSSYSMKTEDFKTKDSKPSNRLDVAKKVLAEFIKGRKSDRIGLVVFASESFTQCPLTLDYNIILQQLKHVNFDMIDCSSTAIGMAIANAVNRLRYSKAKNKIIILLTDGENNAGVIDPITASEAAAAFNIKIYTIGAGKKEGTPIFDYHPLLGKVYRRNSDGTLMMYKLDEETLRDIAGRTGGKYFRATDSNALRKVYKKIDKLEKTKIKTKQYFQYTENFQIFLFIGILLLLGYIVLNNLILIKVP